MPSRRRAGIARGCAASLAAHATAAALLVGMALLDPRARPAEPEQRAEIEIVTGDNAARTGHQTPVPQDAAPPAPAPSPQMAPTAPTAAPSTPEGDVGAGAPPAPAAPATPPVQPPQPVLAQQPQPPARAAATPPEIRIGDGVAIAAAEIEESGTVHPAEAEIGNVPPEYPPDAARRRERGIVTLRVFIAADGHVERVEVARSSGHESLDRAARDRIATWHFRPARRNGKPVPDTEEQAIRFLPE